MASCSEDFLCGGGFDAVSAIFRFYRYGAKLLRQLRKSLQMKKIVTNAACALQFEYPQHINRSRKDCLLRTQSA